MPKTSSADAAITAAQELVHALKHPTAALPLAPISEPHREALNTLAEIFNQVVNHKQPASPPSIPTDSAAPAHSSAEPVPDNESLPAANPRVPEPTPAEPTFNQRTNRNVKFSVPLQSTHLMPTRSRKARTNQAHFCNVYTGENSDNQLPIYDAPCPREESVDERLKRLKPSKPFRPSCDPSDDYNPPPKPPANNKFKDLYLGQGEPDNSRQTPTAFSNAVVDPVTGDSLEYQQLIKGNDKDHWLLGNIKEIGRLTDGRVGGVTGTNTMFFRPSSSLPAGHTATYLRVVCNYRPQKEDPYRVRWTVGGNRVDYPGKVTTPTADLTTAKLLWNSTISTRGAKYACVDIKDFYLNTPMERSEYMWVPRAMLPDEVMDAYGLHEMINPNNGSVLVEIQRGMYGLPQAGRLAWEKLVKVLAPYGYKPANCTAGLWRHESWPTRFALVVDDFGIKYEGMEN